ncbi:TniQ family protein [Novosphingobium sp. G106]|nr:TniQ family protein [Novosphingobium sp. G106]
MTDYLAPLPGELLTSWFARRSHKLQARAKAEPRAVQDRRGTWRHPDVQPTRSWLIAAATKFHVDAAVLAANSLARLRPGVPVDLLAWERPPFSEDVEGFASAPRLAKAWCSRCLAEDFVAGRPAHIRKQWADAATSFCRLHRWPLFDQCPFCRSCKWRLIAPRRGPLRTSCAECWHPLDQATPCALTCADEYRDQWDCVTAFEAELHAALRGRTPDQFRFNFTSACQLINEVRDICSVLLFVSTGYEATSIPLNAYRVPQCGCTDILALSGHSFAVPARDRDHVAPTILVGSHLCNSRPDGASGSSTLSPG